MSDNQIRSAHYGGSANVYEAIKVITAWNANFNLGNAIKYICRVCYKYKYQGQIDSPESRKVLISDLTKAKTYIEFEIERISTL